MAIAKTIADALYSFIIGITIRKSYCSAYNPLITRKLIYMLFKIICAIKNHLFCGFVGEWVKLQHQRKGQKNTDKLCSDKYHSQ